MNIDTILLTDEPWQQAENESDQAYAGFLAYANLPKETRSYREAFRQFQERGGRASLSLFLTWPETFQWQRRAIAWDAHRIARIEDVWVEREIAAREKMWKISNVIFDQALAALKELGEERIPASAIARLLDIAMRLEAAATPRGSMTPTDIRELLRSLPRDTRVQVVQLLMAERKENQ